MSQIVNMAEPPLTLDLSRRSSKHELFDLYSPALLVATFVVTVAYQTYQLEDSQPRQQSQRSRRVLTVLTGCVATGFIALSLQYVAHPASLSENAFVHNLCQLLLWITLFLSLVVVPSTTTPTFLPTWCLSCLVESITLLADVRALKASGFVYTTQAVLQAVIITLHFILIMCGSIAPRGKPAFYDCEESQALLGTADDASHDVDSPRKYDSTPNKSDSCSSEDENPDSGTDDDDEKELKAARKEKLRASGGWTGYLKSFKVFIPFVIPCNDLRLQLYVVGIVISTLLQRVLNVLHPLQLSIVIDRLATDKQIPWNNIAFWIIIEVLASDSVGLGILNEALQHRISAWSRQEIYMAAFDTVMSLSMSFHDQKDSGEIIRALEQAGSLNDLFQLVVLEIAPGVLDVVVSLWYVGYLFDIYATLIVVAVGIAYIFITLHMSNVIAENRRTSSTVDRDQSKILFESVSNWATVSYFNRKNFETSRLYKAVSACRSTSVRSEDTYTVFFGVQEVCEQVGRYAVSLLAVYRIATGDSTVGKFVALQSYWGIITRPLYLLGYAYRTLSMHLIDAERLLQIFETPIAVKDNYSATQMLVEKGEVEFSDVGFAYEGRQATLDQISFTAKTGQTIALVGETGSGKSTLLKLLMRFYDVTNGSIKIDGQDIRDVSIESLREAFGFVPQDSVLFNTTIIENVRYGRLDATDEEVYQACRQACIHDKILSFPGGYRSRVGERGVKLSGGERQRIAIARVILRRPKIVLLDEATSAMDSLTESKIQTALSRLMKGQTAFVIAHRLSTVADADMILVLENGRIIERGTHNELLKKGGRYIDLWKKQEMVVDEEATSDA